MGGRGGTWYSRSIRLACAREGDENLEGTFVPPMWNSDGFSPTISQHQQNVYSRGCKQHVHAPLYQRISTLGFRWVLPDNFPAPTIYIMAFPRRSMLTKRSSMFTSMHAVCIRQSRQTVYVSQFAAFFNKRSTWTRIS